MPISVIDIPNKIYKIGNAEFKLKAPTLGTKRQATFFASGLHTRMQELVALVKNNEKELKKANEKNSDSFRNVYESIDYLEKRFNEVFIKGEEFFKMVLIPVKAGDEDMLKADNLDENIIKEVLEDFFIFAGLSKELANK